MESAKNKNCKNKHKRPTNCESCEFYDYNADTDEYECRVSLDEDDYIKFMSGQNNDCPYYRYYDEYTSVRKQN